MEMTVLPLAPELWPAFEKLFGSHGASNGCWCMYWRIGSAYRNRPREMNRLAFHNIVDKGPPPGLLAFHGNRPVGWCQLTARADLPWLNRTKALQPVDDRPVWSVSCFYVDAGFRRQGVMKVLIQAAVQEAKRQGAPALEAYPIDTVQPNSSRNVFTGTAVAFARAGFKVVAARAPQRPIMRHDLRDRIRKG
jgi:GNAT superfamily N-acetyltransferase